LILLFAYFNDARSNEHKKYCVLLHVALSPGTMHVDNGALNHISLASAIWNWCRFICIKLLRDWDKFHVTRWRRSLYSD